MPKLTERAVAAAKPREKVYRLSDGSGLLLEVRPGGGRAWIYRFMLSGRRRDMGLGSYPAVGLANARQKARAAAELAKAGTDPIAARDDVARGEAEAKAALAAQNERNFEAAAERLIAVQMPGWTGAKTLWSWRFTLHQLAYPTLAQKPVADITREDVLAVLAPIWTTKPAIARKVQRRVAAVLDYAAALGWRSTDNPATGKILRLTKALPKQPPEQKQPSLAWQKVPAFLVALDKQEGVASLALQFAILTAVRSNEVRHAIWSEIDLPNRIWTIPAQRMKGGRSKAMAPHRVPLTDAMIVILRRMMELHTGEPVRSETLGAQVSLGGRALIFPGQSGRALSDATFGACVKRMNRNGPAGAPVPWMDVDERPIVPHGFRRSFRSWVDDMHPEAGEAAEKALAHEDTNTVRAAYRGSDMLEQRRPLMGEWGRFCSGTPTRARAKPESSAKQRSQRSSVPRLAKSML